MVIEGHLKGLPPDSRPRERIYQLGAENLADHELLALILGHGTAKQDVISLSQGLVAYLQARQSTPTVDELAQLHGIGRAKACQIAAILELGRRFLVPKSKVSIKSPRDALPYLRQIQPCRQEKFAVLTLDGHHQVLGTHIVTVGLANQSQIHPRETFYPAVKDQAVSIIAAHNHPSGHLEPSEADLIATRKLHEAGKILGIPLLDHLILAESGIVSIREKHPGCFEG